jgi:hypothetical protein
LEINTAISIATLTVPTSSGANFQYAQANHDGLRNSVEDDRENKRNDKLRLVGGLDRLALTASNFSNQPVAEEERESPRHEPQCGNPAELGELECFEDQFIGNCSDQHPGPERHDDPECSLAESQP